MHIRNNKYAKKLAGRITARMDELGLSISELSERSGIARANIFYYCRGDVIPKADIVVKLAHGLNMTTDELINFQA